METTVKSNRTWYWCLYGLWCSAGAVAMGALLTYLTNWPIGVVCGIATASLIVIAWRTNDRPTVELKDKDLADELRTGLRYSNHPGNVLNVD
jgi:hypothetical protein